MISIKKLGEQYKMETGVKRQALESVMLVREGG